MSSVDRSRTSFNTLGIILAFIFADIVCENFIVLINNQQSSTIATTFLLCFMGFEIFFAPIQAGFSDLGRKKAIIISISLSLVSLLCIYLFLIKSLPYLALLFIAIAIKGVWGNTVALSWSAIADTQVKNYRASYALGSGIYAVSYLILNILSNFRGGNSISIFFPLVILLIVLLLCIFLFKDKEDKTIKKDTEIEIIQNSSQKYLQYFLIFWEILKKDQKKIISNLRERATRQALFAYLLWSISMYSILISQIDLRHGNANNHIVNMMMVGYLTGIAILISKWVLPVKNSIIVRWGYYISFFSLVPYFLFFPFLSNLDFIIVICYYFHALGNSFLSPTLLTIVSKEKPRHEQGKILGLVESADTTAFLIALAFVMFYNRFHLHLVYLVGFSFISFSISWLYYSRFREKEVD